MQPCTTTTRSTAALTGPARAHRRRRRASVMIFVLGILTLLALVGLLLIAKTHGEFRRVVQDSNATSIEAGADGAVRQISDILRNDVLGDLALSIGDPNRPLSGNAPFPSVVNQQGLRENNEPWDKPGIHDRWLADLLPRYVGTVAVNNGVATEFEQDVLVWPHVSYPGIDILLPTASNPFVWADNFRTPGAGLVQYGQFPQLEHIGIIQTPVVQTPGTVFSSTGFLPTTMIPGSTTNVSIRLGRSIWQHADHGTALASALASGGVVPGLQPQFPYFDTNADGVPDLYDADGDGIPDSPISFVLQMDTADPNGPGALYAAVRIVDHAAMLDLNAASAMVQPDGSLTFDEQMSWHQRRGRSATEFYMDGVLHRDDWLEANRAGNAMARRDNSAAPDPLFYDADVVRRTLIGGRPQTLRQYFPFDLREESSLRHRFMLVPYDRIGENAAVAGDYSNLDRALRNTLLWNRSVVDNPNSMAYSYDDAQSPRWNRFNFDYQPAGVAGTYEGYTDINNHIGARKLLDEDESWFVRRPLLTTASRAVQMPPNILSGTMPSVVVTPGPNDTALDIRLRQLWALGMNWPVLIDAARNPELASDPAIPTGGGSLFGRFIVDSSAGGVRFPAEWARVNPVDLNMSNPADAVSARADFVRFAAAAMFLALDGVPSVQGVPLNSPVISVPMREYFAWQFAANLADYRDSDSVPTIVQWPNTNPPLFVFGVEKQPFFTEAYAHLTVGDSSAPPSGPIGTNPGPGGTGPDQWFYAFELFVPPGWVLSTDNLYFRRPDLPNTLLPLNTFLQVTNNLPASTLDGGPVDINAVADADHGTYYVFCGNRSAAPASIINDPTFQARGFFNDGLTIANDGGGALELVWSPTGTFDDPLNHVLDRIDPANSGGSLAGDTPSGAGSWARRPPGNLPPGTQRGFSLRRSTKGWRFTTAWQVYSESLVGGLPGAGGVPHNRSLGRPNDVLNQLNDNIPESVWPALTNAATANGEPLFPTSANTLAPGFASGLPYEAFDSVGELGKLFMIGAVDSVMATAFGAAAEDLAPTDVLARILNNAAPGDLPPNTEDRVAAGRVDFFGARRVGSSPSAPWTWRLFDYFTTSSHLFDAIDNDGDGLFDLDDPTEAADVRFARAGLPNLNTAPATVLRSGPHMSLLPASPELVFYDATGLQDPAGSFNGAAPGFYHDFASAIIALRDDRPVPLRLRQGANGGPATVAIAQRKVLSGIGASTTVTDRKAFASVAELAEINENKMIDALGTRNDAFRIDRLSPRGNLALTYHTVQTDPNDIEHSLGTPGHASPFSPDFRYRRDSQNADFVPIRAAAAFTGSVNQVQSDPFDGAGIRGRDAYYARLTNLYATRSDVFTAYIVLIDEDGNYVHRAQVTLDRSVCFDEILPGGLRDKPIPPRILVRRDGSYVDDTK